MEIIQRSIFVLCLDKAPPGLPEKDAKIFAAEQMLHGGGSQLNSANRWFDKTLEVTNQYLDTKLEFYTLYLN